MNKLYEDILFVVQHSRCKEVEDGCYEFKLMDDNELLDQFSGNRFYVQIGAEINEWVGKLWVNQSVFRRLNGEIMLVSHTDSTSNDDNFQATKQMAIKELASYLYYILKKGKENEE